MKKEDDYRSGVTISETKGKEAPVEFIERYAKKLHDNKDVVEDLLFASEANSEDYTEEEFEELGAKVHFLMDKSIREIGLNPYTAESSSVFRAMCDFNGWYIEKVIHDGENFEESLLKYKTLSPFVRR